MKEIGKMDVSSAHLNKRDIAIQARGPEGQLIGFVWVGLMAQGTVGYVDKFVVHPSYAGQKVGLSLLKAMVLEANRRKITSLFANICRDEFHDRSAMGSLRMAAGAHPLPYTLVEVNVNKCLKEIGLG